MDYGDADLARQPVRKLRSVLYSYIAPGLFAEKIFTPITAGFFGMTGLASFIAALFTCLFIGTIGFSFLADKFGRRTILTYSLLWYSACTLILAFQHSAEGVISGG